MEALWREDPPNARTAPTCCLGCSGTPDCHTPLCEMSRRILRGGPFDDDMDPLPACAALAELGTQEAFDQLEHRAASQAERIALPAMYALAWSVSPASAAALKRACKNGAYADIAAQCLSVQRVVALVPSRSPVELGAADDQRSFRQVALCGFTSSGKSAAGRALQERGASVVEFRRFAGAKVARRTVGEPLHQRRRSWPGPHIPVVRHASRKLTRTRSR
jgi:hypothetical protein